MKKCFVIIITALGLLRLGFQAKPAQAAITFVTSTAASFLSSSVINATTTAVDTTGATLLVAEVGTRSPTSTVTLTDSDGNTWNALGWSGSDTHAGWLQMYYAYNPTVGANHTFHLNNSATSTHATLQVGAFSGTLTTSAVYDTGTFVATLAGTATSTYSGTSTPSLSSDLFVTGWASQAQFTSTTVSNGFTIDKTNLAAGSSDNAADGYFISADASAQNPLWATNSTATTMGMVANIAAFESASALPTINSFSATPSSTISGATSTLLWNIASNTATTTISISPGSFSTSTLVASTTANPTSTTTYTLTATNVNGTSTATTTVTITPLTPPTVTATSSAVATSTAMVTATITATGGQNSTVMGANYGTSTSYGSVASTTGSFAANATSSFNISGLLCSTTYHYQGFATNSGGTGTSTDQTFITPSCIINFPIAAATAETAAYVTWRTPETGSSQVNYGLTNAYGSSVSSSTSVLYHALTITGLSAGTTYHYQVVSTDANGNTATSADHTFITLAAPGGTVKTVKPSGGDYTSVQACATAASAGWTCEVYSGGAVDTSVISVSSSGSSGSPITFIAHDAVELPGFSLADGASYITIEGFELSTAVYSAYQSCSLQHDIAIGNGSNNEIIQSNYIHNVYDGGFVREKVSTNISSNEQVLNNVMAFAVITNQNPPYSHPCGTSSGGEKGIILAGSYNLVDGNDIQEADHLIELGGSYDVARRNVGHDTYAPDYGASSTLSHVDFFHPTTDDIHQVIEDNQDYNRNDTNEHFLLDEGYTVQSSSSLGQGDGVTKTFSGTLNLASSSAIAPFSVDVIACTSSSTSSCNPGNAAIADNGFGSLTGNGTGTVTYSGAGAGNISVTFTTAPTSSLAIEAFYGLDSSSSHDVIVRENLVYNVGSGFVGAGNGGVSGIRIYNNTTVHDGYEGSTSTPATSGNIGMYGGSSSHNASPNWVAINNIFDDAFKYQSYSPWGYSSASGTQGDGVFMAPPERAPGYSLAFISACDPTPGCAYGSKTTAAPGMVVSQDPLLNSTSTYDFTLQSGSPAKDVGTYLTTVASTDSGSGTTLVVSDAGFFQDGYGITGVDSDCISVTTVSNHICITAVNYDTNTITLTSAITRSVGDHIWLYSDSLGQVKLVGSAPDLGAYEFGQTSTYTVGGTVSGLSGTVILQNASDTRTMSANGSFAFATPTSTGRTYNVTILTQPSGQTCSVSNGSGTISGANVTSVSVSCAATSATTQAASSVGEGGGGSVYFTPVATTTTSAVVIYPTTVLTPSGLLALVKSIRSLTLEMLQVENHDRNLMIGSNGKDVWALQVFLIINNLLIPAGPESLKLVNPSGYFGPITQAALREYQASVGTIPATGYFGPKTRGLLLAVNGGQTVAPSPSPAPAVSSSTLPFTKDLSLGMKDPEVLTLQAFLAKDTSIYPDGFVTGLYGERTEAAVKSFQLLRGIHAAGEPGWGIVDAPTRAKLNELYMIGKMP